MVRWPFGRRRGGRSAPAPAGAAGTQAGARLAGGWSGGGYRAWLTLPPLRPTIGWRAPVTIEVTEEPTAVRTGWRPRPPAALGVAVLRFTPRGQGGGMASVLPLHARARVLTPLAVRTAAGPGVPVENGAAAPSEAGAPVLAGAVLAGAVLAGAVPAGAELGAALAAEPPATQRVAGPLAGRVSARPSAKLTEATPDLVGPPQAPQEPFIPAVALADLPWDHGWSEPEPSAQAAAQDRDEDPAAGLVADPLGLLALGVAELAPPQEVARSPIPAVLRRATLAESRRRGLAASGGRPDASDEPGIQEVAADVSQAEPEPPGAEPAMAEPASPESARVEPGRPAVAPTAPAPPPGADQARTVPARAQDPAANPAALGAEEATIAAAAGSAEPAVAVPAEPARTGFTEPAVAVPAEPTGTGFTEPAAAVPAEPTAAGFTEPAAAGSAEPAAAGSAEPAGTVPARPGPPGFTTTEPGPVPEPDSAFGSSPYAPAAGVQRATAATTAGHQARQPLVYRDSPRAGPMPGPRPPMTRPPGQQVASTHPVPAAIADRVRQVHVIDVSDVVIERGPAVSLRAHQLDARAFTEAGTVFLPEEASDVADPANAALLGHELTHVAQQREFGADLPAENTEAGQELEAEARSVEQWLAGGPQPPQPLRHLLPARPHPASATVTPPTIVTTTTTVTAPPAEQPATPPAGQPTTPSAEQLATLAEQLAALAEHPATPAADADPADFDASTGEPVLAWSPGHGFSYGAAARTLGLPEQMLGAPEGPADGVPVVPASALQELVDHALAGLPGLSAPSDVTEQAVSPLAGAAGEASQTAPVQAAATPPPDEQPLDRAAGLGPSTSPAATGSAAAPGPTDLPLAPASGLGQAHSAAADGSAAMPGRAGPPLAPATGPGQLGSPIPGPASSAPPGRPGPQTGTEPAITRSPAQAAQPPGAPGPTAGEGLPAPVAASTPAGPPPAPWTTGLAGPVPGTPAAGPRPGQEVSRSTATRPSSSPPIAAGPPFPVTGEHAAPAGGEQPSLATSDWPGPPAGGPAAPVPGLRSVTASSPPPTAGRAAPRPAPPGDQAAAQPGPSVPASVLASLLTRATADAPAGAAFVAASAVAQAVAQQAARPAPAGPAVLVADIERLLASATSLAASELSRFPSLPPPAVQATPPAPAELPMPASAPARVLPQRAPLDTAQAAPAATPALPWLPAQAATSPRDLPDVDGAGLDEDSPIPVPPRELASFAELVTELIGQDPPRHWVDLDDSGHLDELSTKIYDRLNDRLRSDVLVQRERSGRLMDAW